MGLFKCFQRRSHTDEDLYEPSPSKKKQGRRSRSNSPYSSDDDIVERKSSQPSPMGRTTMQAPPEESELSKLDDYDYNPQLSRITEEPTVMSSSTAGWGTTPTKTPTPKHSPAPPAREAAFHGPPRFDWIDIETSAATKIQSIYRRNKVMKVMEKQGVTTSAIRNRKRRRKAKRGKAVASGDVPSFLSCCAVGLAFGDATEEDDEAYRDYQKKQYEERVKQQQIHEEALRKRYLKSHGTEVGNVVERIEVVE